MATRNGFSSVIFHDFSDHVPRVLGLEDRDNIFSK